MTGKKVVKYQMGEFIKKHIDEAELAIVGGLLAIFSKIENKDTAFWAGLGVIGMAIIAMIAGEIKEKAIKG